MAPAGTTLSTLRRAWLSSAVEDAHRVVEALSVEGEIVTGREEIEPLALAWVEAALSDETTTELDGAWWGTAADVAEYLGSEGRLGGNLWIDERGNPGAITRTAEEISARAAAIWEQVCAEYLRGKRSPSGAA